MVFDTVIYFPQSQGGPNPKGVGKGSGFLFETLKNQLPFHQIPADSSTTATKNNIQHYDPLLANLKTATSWLKPQDIGTVFTLGGDCSIDVAIINKLNATYGKNFGLIWIDAHADIHVPEGSASKFFHGMPLRTLLGEGDAAMLKTLSAPLTHRQFCYAGIRSIDAPEAEYIAKHKLPVLTSEQINAGNYTVFSKWLKNSGIKHLHIHFDLDALDPADDIEVTYHVPNGIRHAAMKKFLTFLHGHGLTVGFTVTEYAAQTKKTAEINKILELVSTVVTLPEILAA